MSTSACQLDPLIQEVQRKLNRITEPLRDGHDCGPDKVRNLLESAGPRANLGVNIKGIHCPSNLQLLSILGKGKQGTVFKVRNQGTQELAMKQMQRNSMSPLEIQVSLLLASLRCDRMVPDIHAVFFDEDENTYMVMDIVDQDLGTFIHDEKTCNDPGKPRMSQNDIRRFIKEGLDILFKLEATGIIHRDIKPHNCGLINGSLVLFDFGSVMLTDVGKSAAHGMTPPYMPVRDVFRDKKFTTHFDTYSFGCMMISLMRGHHVWLAEFESTGNPNLLQYIFNDHEEKLKKMIPHNCPDDIRDLIERMVTYDMNNRITLKEAKDHPAIKSDPYGRIAVNSSTYDAAIINPPTENYSPPVSMPSACGGKLRSDRRPSGKSAAPYTLSSSREVKGNVSRQSRKMTEYARILPKPTIVPPTPRPGTTVQPLYSGLVTSHGHQTGIRPLAANLQCPAQLGGTQATGNFSMFPQRLSHSTSTSGSPTSNQPIITLQQLISTCGKERAYQLLLKEMVPEQIEAMRSQPPCVPLEAQHETGTAAEALNFHGYSMFPVSCQQAPESEQQRFARPDVSPQLGSRAMNSCRFTGPGRVGGEALSLHDRSKLMVKESSLETNQTMSNVQVRMMHPNSSTQTKANEITGAFPTYAMRPMSLQNSATSLHNPFSFVNPTTHTLPNIPLQLPTTVCSDLNNQCLPSNQCGIVTTPHPEAAMGRLNTAHALPQVYQMSTSVHNTNPPSALSTMLPNRGFANETIPVTATSGQYLHNVRAGELFGFSAEKTSLPEAKIMPGVLCSSSSDSLCFELEDTMLGQELTGMQSIDSSTLQSGDSGESDRTLEAVAMELPDEAEAVQNMNNDSGHVSEMSSEKNECLEVAVSIENNYFTLNFDVDKSLKEIQGIIQSKIYEMGLGGRRWTMVSSTDGSSISPNDHLLQHQDITIRFHTDEML